MTTELAPVETPLIPDTLSVWPDRESFLAWCRERGVKGGPPEELVFERDRECLVARALRTLTGRKWSCGELIGDACEGDSCLSLTFPLHISEIIHDFDANQLDQEFYSE